MFSVDVPFFDDEPFKYALFERSKQNVHENQQAKQNHEQVKIKLNTSKRSSFFI